MNRRRDLMMRHSRRHPPERSKPPRLTARPARPQRIIVPIISPGIAATALICFIFSWNELLLANTLTSVVAGTAPVFLTSFVTSQGLFLAKVCAAATVVSLPVLIAGFAAQDKLVQGLSLGAVK
jgi:sorbitol/mannitol transport system permease protein